MVYFVGDSHRCQCAFFNQKLLLVFPLKVAKSLGIRLLEMLVFYFLVGGMALLIERQTGQIVSQGWEFYAITAALFVTCAFQVLYTGIC